MYARTGIHTLKGKSTFSPFDSDFKDTVPVLYCSTYVIIRIAKATLEGYNNGVF